MGSEYNKKSFPAGLLGFLLALAVFKAVTLTLSMMLGLGAFLILVGLDLFYWALCLVPAILLAISKNSMLRFVFWCLLIVLALMYLLDSLVLLALDEHVSLFDIGRYLQEPGIVLSFFNSITTIAISLLLASLFLRCAFTPLLKKTVYGLLALALMIGMISTFLAPSPLKPYAYLDPFDFLAGFNSTTTSDVYSEEQLQFYSSLVRESTSVPASNPDVILLIVESLSSINSEKVSGIPGFLEGFDKLAEEGVLFRNFFANHQASEGGVIALLSGFPPIHFPTASPYMFDEFSIQASVLEEYRRNGYYTEFLTNSDLRFIGLNRYLDGLGLDRARGRDEVVAMRLAPRIVQDAPSDNLLYDEALMTTARLSTTDRPFMLILATTSTHLPYSHPEDGENTAKAVWHWSMQQLLSFHHRLSDSGYFDHGILLITGDHRQMRPLTSVEVDRYGGSARARVPLLAIGNGFTRDSRDERFFQQSDLLRYLGKMNQPDSRLSPHPVWVERYNRKYGRIELIDRLSVFDAADQGRFEYPLKVSAGDIEWLEKTPGFSRRLEARIHRQRSLHQSKRQQSHAQNDKSQMKGSASKSASDGGTD